MSDVTRILSAIEHGDPHAIEQLLPLVYDELRKLSGPISVVLESIAASLFAVRSRLNGAQCGRIPIHGVHSDCLKA
jgi:hypothetical protein